MTTFSTRVSPDEIPDRLEKADALLAVVTGYRNSLAEAHQTLTAKETPVQKPLTKQAKSAVFDTIVRGLTDAGFSRDQAYSRALQGRALTPGEAQESEVRQLMTDRHITRDEAFSIVMKAAR